MFQTCFNVTCIKCALIKCGVHVFSGSFGSAVDQRTKYKLFCEVWGSYIYRLVWLVWLASASKNHCRAKRAGSFGAWLKVALHSVV